MVQSNSLFHPQTTHTVKSEIKSAYTVTYLMSDPAFREEIACASREASSLITNNTLFFVGVFLTQTVFFSFFFFLQ